MNLMQRFARVRSTLTLICTECMYQYNAHLLAHAHAPGSGEASIPVNGLSQGAMYRQRLHQISVLASCMYVTTYIASKLLLPNTYRRKLIVTFPFPVARLSTHMAAAPSISIAHEPPRPFPLHCLRQSGCLVNLRSRCLGQNVTFAEPPVCSGFLLSAAIPSPPGGQSSNARETARIPHSFLCESPWPIPGHAKAYKLDNCTLARQTERLRRNRCQPPFFFDHRLFEPLSCPRQNDPPIYQR